MANPSRDNWINQSMATLASLEEQQADLESELASTKDRARRREIEGEINRLDKEIRQLYAAIESVVKGNKAARTEEPEADDEDDDYASTQVFAREDYTDMIQELMAEDTGTAPAAEPAASPARAATVSEDAPTRPQPVPEEAPTRPRPAPGVAVPASESPAEAQVSSQTASQSFTLSKVQMRALARSEQLKRNVSIALAIVAAGFIIFIIWASS